MESAAAAIVMLVLLGVFTLIIVIPTITLLDRLGVSRFWAITVFFPPAGFWVLIWRLGLGRLPKVPEPRT
jgi:hypothetical protein